MEISIADLERERTYNEMEIEAQKTQLKALVEIYGDSTSTMQYETFNQKISSLVTRNVQIEKELETLKKSLAQGTVDDKAFAAELESCRAKIAAQTEIYQDVSAELYNKESKTRYDSLTSDGALGLVMPAILGFLGTFLIGSVIVCCIDIPKQRKKQQTAEASTIADATEKKQEE